MEKFFNMFGKTMLIVIVLGSLTYSGYYFGKQTKTGGEETKITESEQKPVQQAVPTTEATIQPFVTVVAGLSKSLGLSFDQYSIMIPPSWNSKKEQQSTTDEKLILEKDGAYTISIFQAATGGALCLYPNDPEFEGPSSRFNKFIDLTTKDNRNLRRSGEGVAFTVCQKSADGSYQQPTNYGHISIKMPAEWDQKGLDEIDQIISSLRKI